MTETGAPMQVSLSDMREAVLAIYKSRKNLALTLQDAHTVIAKLELIFGSVLHVLAFFVYLVIFQVESSPCGHPCTQHLKACNPVGRGDLQLTSIWHRGNDGMHLCSQHRCLKHILNVDQSRCCVCSAC